MKTLYSLRKRAAFEDEPIDTSKLREDCTAQLIQLIKQGPVEDGNILCKSHRDSLIEAGFAAKVIVNQEEAGTCATYYGRMLFNQLMDVSGFKDGLKKLEELGGTRGLYETLKAQSAPEEVCDARPCSSN
jgi:hypothetical protein